MYLRDNSFSKSFNQFRVKSSQFIITLLQFCKSAFMDINLLLLLLPFWLQIIQLNLLLNAYYIYLQRASETIVKHQHKMLECVMRVKL